MASSADVHMMGPHPTGVLAEVEAAWRPRNLGVQALSTNPVPQPFHRAVKTSDGLGLAQDRKDVDDGLCRKVGNRSAPDVMNIHQRIGEQMNECAGLASEGHIPSRIVLHNLDRTTH